jgi:hypothetical protein
LRFRRIRLLRIWRVSGLMVRNTSVDFVARCVPCRYGDGDVKTRTSKLVLLVTPCTTFALLLSSCASLVTKDATTTYTEAAQKLVAQVKDTGTALAKYEQESKLDWMSTDKMCPVQSGRLFARDKFHKPNPAFQQAVDYMSIDKTDECAKLIECETSKQASGYCKQACYTAEEAHCIVQLDHDYAAEIAKGSNDKVMLARANALTERISEIEFGAQAPIENQMLADAVDSLSAYMTMLSKLAKHRDSEIPGDAKALATKVTSIQAKYESLTGRKLSSSTTDERDHVTGAIQAFATLAGDLQNLVKDANDVAAIKRTVNAQDADVEHLIATIETFVSADAELGATYQLQANIHYIDGLAEKYSRAKSDAERAEILAKRSARTSAGDVDVQGQLKAVFDKLSVAHENLLSIINNPTDAQKKEIQEEEFSEFKRVTKEAADVLQSVAKV